MSGTGRSGQLNPSNFVNYGATGSENLLDINDLPTIIVSENIPNFDNRRATNNYSAWNYIFGLVLVVFFFWCLTFLQNKTLTKQLNSLSYIYQIAICLCVLLIVYRVVIVSFFHES